MAVTYDKVPSTRKVSATLQARAERVGLEVRLAASPRHHLPIWSFYRNGVHVGDSYKGSAWLAGYEVAVTTSDGEGRASRTYGQRIEEAG